MSHMLSLKLFGKYQNRQMLNQIEETRRTLDDINSKIHTLKCEFGIVIGDDYCEKNVRISYNQFEFLKIP